jgi:hypothetical protein
MVEVVPDIIPCYDHL